MEHFYIMQYGSYEFWKVGATRVSVESRRRALQTASIATLHIIYDVECDDAFAVEHRVKLRLSPYRVSFRNEEVFAVSETIITALIKELNDDEKGYYYTQNHNHGNYANDDRPVFWRHEEQTDTSRKALLRSWYATSCPSGLEYQIVPERQEHVVNCQVHRGAWVQELSRRLSELYANKPE